MTNLYSSPSYPQTFVKFLLSDNLGCLDQVFLSSRSLQPLHSPVGPITGQTQEAENQTSLTETGTEEKIWDWVSSSPLTVAESIWPARSELPSERRCLRGTMSVGTVIGQLEKFKGSVLSPELTNIIWTVCLSMFRCVLTSSWARLALSSSLLDFFRASGPTTDRTVRNLSSQKNMATKLTRF